MTATKAEKPLTVVPDAEPTVFQALRAVMRDLKPVGKDRVNEQQHFKFRGIDQAMNAAHPLFAQHGVLTVPTVLERIAETRETKSGGSMNVVHLRIRYRFYGPAGDYVDAEVWGEAQDSADKATNKAMAVAMKYALFQTLCIPTEDQPDPDAEAVSASRASDEQTLAELEAELAAATTPEQLGLFLGKAKIAYAARKINRADADRLRAAYDERVKKLAETPPAAAEADDMPTGEASDE